MVENSTITFYPPGTTWELMKVSAAMKGMLAGQKSVLVFAPDTNGEHVLHDITIPSGDIKAIHESLNKNGLVYHTIVPNGDTTSVYIYSGDHTIDENVIKFSEENNGKAGHTPGTGEFIGGNTREEGRAAYEREIEAFGRSGVSQQAQVAEFWRHYDNWMRDPLNK